MARIWLEVPDELVKYENFNKMVKYDDGKYGKVLQWVTSNANETVFISPVLEYFLKEAPPVDLESCVDWEKIRASTPKTDPTP